LKPGSAGSKAEVPESRKFIKKPAIAIVLTFAALALGGIATAVLVFGQPLGNTFE
jgi:hypothetical protein